MERQRRSKMKGKRRERREEECGREKKERGKRGQTDGKGE